MSILSSLLKLGQGTPTQQIPTAVQTTEIAQEVAPFIKDILAKSQALYKERMAEGFVPFEGQTLADVTADQLAAQEGLRGLVGSQAGGLQEARELVRRQTQQATAEELQPFMNPYQQAVTDIAKRKAQEQFEQETLPGLRKQAIDAGAFGGSRAAMRESQARDAQARLLADIQAKGDLAAFQDARQAFEQQKTRERQAAEGLSGLTGAEFQARRAELGGLEAVGREQQQRQQQLLDESYQRFLQERGFPEQQLGTYQGFVSGASPFLRTTQTTMGPQQFQPSPIASALGTAAAGLGTFKAAQDLNLFSKEGGPVIPAEEGTPGGLRGIMIKIIRAQRGKGGDPRSKRSEEIRTKMQQEDVTRMLEEMDMQAGGLIDLPVVKRADAGILMDDTAANRAVSNLGEGVSKIGRAAARVPADIYQMGADVVNPVVEFFSGLGRSEELDIPDETVLTQGSTKQLLKQKEEKEKEETKKEENIKQKKEREKILANLDKRQSSTINEKPAIEIEGLLEKVRTGREDQKGIVKGIADQLGGLRDEQKKMAEQDKASIESERQQTKREGAIDFLMGLSKGLLQGGTRGGLLADLTRGGEAAVESTKPFRDQFKKLNREEREVARNLVKQQYETEIQRLNTMLQLGEIDSKIYNDAIQLLTIRQQVLDRDNQALIQSTQLGADILATYRTGGITGNTAINRLDNLYQGGRGPLSKADYDYFKQDIQGETATDSNNLSEEVSIEDESQS